MIGRLRQLSEPRLRNSQTPVDRDILIQWVRKIILISINAPTLINDPWIAKDGKFLAKILIYVENIRTDGCKFIDVREQLLFGGN